MEKLALVALGGAMGASLRYGAVAAMGRMYPGFPWGTVLVNVAGSLVMGLMAVVLMERFPGAFARLGPLVMTGILGGFTTFSAFSLDVLFLIERGRPGAAAGYVLLSVCLSIGALWVGLKLARQLLS